MFFMTWRYSKRLEHYREMKGPSMGGKSKISCPVPELFFQGTDRWSRLLQRRLLMDATALKSKPGGIQPTKLGKIWTIFDIRTAVFALSHPLSFYLSF
jgi:hypothetical protein